MPLHRPSLRRAGQRASLCTASLLLLFCWLSSASAEPDDGEGAAAAPAELPATRPPALAQPPQPVYPSAARQEGLGGAVTVALTVADDGTVRDVALVEAAGHGFDEAALEEARRLRFEPALRDGQPIAARIHFRFVFEPPLPEPMPVQPAPEPDPGPVPRLQSQPEPPSELASDEPLVYAATARAQPPPSTPTRRSLDGARLTRIAGTRGDALKAIEVLPGVAQSADGQPRLRGNSADQSQVYFGGAPAPVLYHFDGLTGVFQSRLLERVDLYPGNFSVRYGRVSGGVVDVTVADPRRDELHAMLDVALLDSSALLETPLGEDVAIALAARRSNIDLVFDQLVPDDAFSVVAAPVYWDYQALAVIDLSSRHALRVRAFGSRDTLRLLLSEPDDEDPGLRGRIDGRIEFHRAQVELDSRFSSALSQRLQLTLGHGAFVQRLQDLDSELSSNELYARNEWRLSPMRAVTVVAGVDVELARNDGRYFGPRPPQNDGDPASQQRLQSRSSLGIEDTVDSVNPAAYVEVTLRPWEPLSLSPGLRVDYFGQLDRFTLDPRLALRYALGETTTLKAGFGRFTQPPIWWAVIEGIGNPELEPVHTLQWSAGVEQKAGALELGLEGFFQRMNDRVVATEGGVEPYFINDGVGRSYGLELSVSARPSERVFAYLAYTLSRSERSDRGQPYRLFDYDQTHVLSLAGSYDLGAGWELGARFRLVTGTPQTSVVGAVYDATRGAYVPRYGPVNSDRSPTFHALDLRIEKLWRWSAWSLAAYLDLQNAYNAQNVEGTRYSHDYRDSEPVSGLPIFPNLGLRGEL